MKQYSKIVANALDDGLIPWRLTSFPRNVASGRLFGGVSPILLQIAATRLNGSSSWWGTSSQWQAAGNWVEPGEESFRPPNDDLVSSRK